MELKKRFTTAKGNLVELVGAEKHGREWRYMVKVNGKHQKKTYTERELIQMING